MTAAELAAELEASANFWDSHTFGNEDMAEWTVPIMQSTVSEVREAARLLRDMAAACEAGERVIDGSWIEPDLCPLQAALARVRGEESK